MKRLPNPRERLVALRPPDFRHPAGCGVMMLMMMMTRGLGVPRLEWRAHAWMLRQRSYPSSLPTARLRKKAEGNVQTKKKRC